jgi:glycosyltransferase involved in cell wall biosynthesis
MTPSTLQVVHVVDNLERGGLEHVVCDLAVEQLRRGYTVSVYCLHVPGALAAGLSARGVPVLCGYKRRGPDLRVMRQLGALLRTAPGLLHSHSMMPNYYACAARLLMHWSTVVVNTRHDMGSTRAKDLRERLYRLSVPLTRLAVMVSRNVRDHFVTAGIVPASKARLVLNGIHTDCPQCSDPSQRAAARQQLQVGAEDFVYGCVGRLVPLKDHATAIRAFAEMFAQQPHSRLALLGDGPLRAELETLAAQLGVSSAMRFLGQRNDVRALLPGLDAFVMPSLTEGHSIALLEAMAAGSAVLATGVGGNPEIVEDGESGLLVAPGNPSALTAAMRRLMDDRLLAARLSVTARAWAEQHVSVRAMADAYEAIYAEALGLQPAQLRATQPRAAHQSQ